MKRKIKKFQKIKVAYFGKKKKNFSNLLGTNFEVSFISATQIRSNDLINKKYSCLVIPGGMAPRHANNLMPKGRQMITKFVKEGGGVLGICAGAYLLCTSERGYDVDWNYGLIKAEILDLNHWNRGSTWDMSVRYTKKGNEIMLNRKNLKKDFVEKLRYANGPLFLIDKSITNDKNISDPMILAKFEKEICKNKAPKGIMKGSPAILAGKYYEGRVIACSPHPEKSPDIYKAHIRNMVRWLIKRKTKYVSLLSK